MWHIHYTKHCLRCTFHRSMRNRVLKANEAFLKSYPYGKLTDPQAGLLRDFLRREDPEAFLTIVNSSEIIGKGFQSI